MSRPNDPNDLFPRADPSGDFGRDEGMDAYTKISFEHPDWPVERIAKYAVQLQMIVDGRFDVQDTKAAEAIVGELDAQVDAP